MLYIVPTPIGNLGDMTYRAVTVLQNATVIYCEDTRTSRVLLDYYDIKTPLKSYHEHNENEKTAEIISRLQAGDEVAIISDAGMPGISDPGFLAVREAQAQNLAVEVLPGASAVITALVASGLATDRFYFGGFWPRKEKDVTALLEDLVNRRETAIFYESPHRIEKTVNRLAEAFPQRETVLCRELSKKFAEVRRLPAQELALDLAKHPAKGEMVLLVAGAEPETPTLEKAVALAQTAMQAGMKPSQAAKQAAQQTGIPKREIYEALLEA